jgi:hypothetical protein
MAEFLTDDVVWLSIADGNVAVKANGKSDLIASMDAYFESCPHADPKSRNRSRLRQGQVSSRSQAGRGSPGRDPSAVLSIYEFSGDLIHRVYYFPAEK